MKTHQQCLTRCLLTVNKLIDFHRTPDFPETINFYWKIQVIVIEH